MVEDSDQLKMKVMLLMQRERELFAMRRQHEQVTQWLKLTQSLPALFQPGIASQEIYARLRKVLIAGLRVQRVSFFELAAEALLPMAPEGPARRLAPAAAELLHSSRAGFCNVPAADGERALAEAVGLERFLWSLRANPEAPAVILVAGFGKDKAAGQSPFDESTAAHLDNVAAHIAAMFENHALVSQLRSANEGLERRVTERTAELAERNRDLHLVLDNVDQAFLTIDRREQVSRARSAMVERWFGPHQDGESFGHYLSRVDDAFATRFSIAYETLLEDFLPEEVCLSQIPSELRVASKEYHFKYFPLRDASGLTGLVIVISDVTEQVRRAHQEAEHRELLALFQTFLRDRAGYLSFVHEAQEIIDALQLEALDPVSRKRLLHTLKGNAAGMEAAVLARLCHRAEDQLSGEAEGSASATIAELTQRWQKVIEALQLVGKDGQYETVEVPLTQVAAVLEDLRAGHSASALERLTLWRTEPAVQPLMRLGQVAQDLAQRLGKGKLQVVVSAAEVRLDFQKWAGFWAGLVHVVRNAVDHGIEDPQERSVAQKSESPRLELRLRSDGEKLVIEIEDDGRGIDWEGVRKVAAGRGLPQQSRADLLEALFAPGFSTRSETNMTSGRGIGLAAVHEQVHALGGTIGVESEQRRGTRWTFALPVTNALPVHFPSASTARS